MNKTFLSRFLDYIKKRNALSVFVLLLGYSFVLMYTDDFKLGIAVSVVVTFLIFYITKNLFLSLFSVFMISLPFASPAKQYQFLYAEPTEYLTDQFPYGLFDKIYFTISNVWGILILLYIADIIIRTMKKRRGTKIDLFLRCVRRPLVLMTLISWLMYFILSALGSLQYSFNSGYSINYLFHEFNLITIYIGIIYLFVAEPNVSKYFSFLLSVMIAFFSIIGLTQIIALFTGYAYIQSQPTYDIEQNLLFSRVGGTLGPNMHAYAIAILLILLIPTIVKAKRRIFYLILVLLSVINIIFSQSRTVWFGIGLSTILYYLYDKKGVIRTAAYLVSKIKLYYIVLFVMALIVIIVPRLETIGLFFTEEGGGTLRQQMLSEGWQMLQQSLLFGFGAGNNVRVMLNNLPNGYISIFPYPVHNTFLQFAIDSGIPAAILFFLPYYLILRGLILQLIQSKQKSNIFFSCFCCISITLIYFFLQPTFGRTELGFSGIILGLGTVRLLKTQPVITS